MKKIKQNLMGIYALSFDGEDNIRYYYIGQASKNGIAKRNSSHFANLKKGKFYYEEFNEAYRKDPDSVRFETLYEVEDESQLSDLEDFYINRYFANMDDVIVVNKWKKNTKTHLRFRSTEKMSDAQQEESNGNARLSKEQIKNILWLKNNSKLTQQAIADKYGCSQSHINAIGNSRWVNVREQIKPIWYTGEDK